MTNADKYLKDGVDVGEFADKICDAYLNGKDNESVFTTTVEWLRKTIKPILTEDEKVILKNIFRGFDKIRRTNIQDGRHLEVYNGYNKIWYEFMYQHLFQFIKPRRRI